MAFIRNAVNAFKYDNKVPDEARIRCNLTMNSGKAISGIFVNEMNGYVEVIAKDSSGNYGPASTYLNVDLIETISFDH